MSQFKKLSEKEIEALSPEEKTTYETQLAEVEQAKKEAKAKEEAAKAESKSKPKAEKAESKVVEKGWETKDGTKFPLFNDAANYARELAGDFVEPKECNL